MSNLIRCQIHPEKKKKSANKKDFVLICSFMEICKFMEIHYHPNVQIVIDFMIIVLSVKVNSMLNIL